MEAVGTQGRVRLESPAFAIFALTEFAAVFGDVAALVLISRYVPNGIWALATILVPLTLLLITVVDRVGRRRLLIASRVFALFGILVAVVLVWPPGSDVRGWPVWFAAFTVVSGTACFSVARHAVVRATIAEHDLSKANGVLRMIGFGAIMLSFLVCARVTDSELGGWLAAFGGVSGAAIVASVLVPKDVASPAGPTLWRISQSVLAVYRTRTMLLTVLGIGYFWFITVLVASAVRSETLASVADSPSWAIVLLGVGGAVGSLLAAQFSAGKVELGLVPFGCFGMGVFLVLLGLSDSFVGVAVCLVLLGVSAGVFLVPLISLLQLRVPSAYFGAVIASANLVAVLFALAGAALYEVAEARSIAGTRVLCWAGFVTLAVTAYVCCLLPEFLFRFLFWALTHTLYRIRVHGREHLPQDGPGLLICNHVSYADGFFLVASTHRLIRFVVWGGIANSPYLRWLTRIMGVIPIASSDGPRALANSLRRARDSIRSGELVCIFAEGQISRTGNMLRFKRGFERVVQGVDAPIIPTFLDCVWGSIFSHQGGRFFWKWPRRIPYPVTVTFGKPLPPSSEAFQVQQAVQELGSESYWTRKYEQRPLHRAFVRQAARHPFRFCMADSRGTELTYGKALAGVIALSRVFTRRLSSQRMVGVLLPPSVGGTLVNLGLLAAGKIPINLNFTASTESIESAVQQCKLDTIISSPEVLKRIRVTLPIEPTPIEELRREVGKLDRFWAMLGAFVLPGWVTDRWLLRLGSASIDDLVTVIFSSGSTGDPKGVMLSHYNVISNSEAVIQVIDPTSADRLVGVLPLFHSFGFLVNVAVPFLAGCGVIFHTNPLEAKEVGELAGKYSGTILLATPTFLRSYTRKVPREHFGNLRWVLTGAEKLPREVADLFREKFGIEPLEGYGCTELSPVAAVNIRDFITADGRQIGNKPGTVGHPIPGVAAKVVDPDTGEPLPTGTDGLLLIKGPNVMLGYLNRPDLTAEVIRDGWYVTGDIARLDEDGFITITDRLSRFSKIGGEMVPHIRIEEAIRKILETDEQGGAVCGVPDADRGERLVVLHPPLPISSDELWRKLNASGIPKLWVPGRDSFFEVPELPYLGTGKLDLRRIKEMARELIAGKQEAAGSRAR